MIYIVEKYETANFMNTCFCHASANVYQDDKYTIIVVDNDCDDIARYKNGVLTKYEQKNN